MCHGDHRLMSNGVYVLQATSGRRWTNANRFGERYNDIPLRKQQSLLRSFRKSIRPDWTCERDCFTVGGCDDDNRSYIRVISRHLITMPTSSRRYQTLSSPLQAVRPLDNRLGIISRCGRSEREARETRRSAFKRVSISIKIGRIIDHSSIISITKYRLVIIRRSLKTSRAILVLYWKIKRSFDQPSSLAWK